MWYSLLFKVFFARKFIKIIFIFYFFKIIFDINTLKNIKTHKILIRNKKINLKKNIYIYKNKNIYNKTIESWMYVLNV
jgi:hypothetical protein